MFVLLALGLMATAPADRAEAKLFTIDANNNDINDLDGSDDLAFSFLADGSLVSGVIRAVDIQVSALTLEGDVEHYEDFSGFGLDFTNMDVLIFDIVLDPGSRFVNLIGTGVMTDPVGLDPDGAGFFLGCDPGMPIGCAHNVPGGGETPDAFDDIFLDPGAPTTPGLALFEYDATPPVSSGNLEGGETTRRLFVAWADPGNGAQTPLSKDGQKARWEFESGQFVGDISAAIVPEPATASLIGLGMTFLAIRRRHAS